jgi:hypothetical protein
MQYVVTERRYLTVHTGIIAVTGRPLIFAASANCTKSVFRPGREAAEALKAQNIPAQGKPR